MVRPAAEPGRTRSTLVGQGVIQSRSQCGRQYYLPLEKSKNSGQHQHLVKFATASVQWRSSVATDKYVLPYYVSLMLVGRKLRLSWYSGALRMSALCWLAEFGHGFRNEVAEL